MTGSVSAVEPRAILEPLILPKVEQGRALQEKRLQSPVRTLSENEGVFRLGLENGSTCRAKHILMATGSNQKVWRLLGDMGHRIVPPVPSLFSVNTRDIRLKSLSGTSFQEVELKAKVQGKTLSSKGPLLITHWGLSGPSVLKLSSLFARELFDANYKFILSINFLPDVTEADIIRLIKKHQHANAKRMLKNSAPEVFPMRYWANLLSALNVHEEMRWAELPKALQSGLIQEIRCAQLSVTGKTTNKEEFVTAGGVELKEIDFRTMESRVLPRMYLAGEVLNVDAVTGGFNFQSAWATSFIAAKSAVARGLTES
jgi:predicted Rossmann fold flavoprotein